MKATIAIDFALAELLLEIERETLLRETTIHYTFEEYTWHEDQESDATETA